MAKGLKVNQYALFARSCILTGQRARGPRTAVRTQLSSSKTS